MTLRPGVCKIKRLAQGTGRPQQAPGQEWGAGRALSMQEEERGFCERENDGLSTEDSKE